MAKNVFKIGIIGHRELHDQGAYHYAQLRCYEIISAFQKKYPVMRAVSAISEGADSLFAQTAILLGVQLDTVIPFERFESDFKNEESYTRYKILRENSKLENNVNFEERSVVAYQKSMEWVVFKSNFIVAIWDGREIGSKGGTWEAITLCKTLKKQFVHINTLEKNMSLYCNKGRSFSMISNISSRNIAIHIN